MRWARVDDKKKRGAKQRVLQKARPGSRQPASVTVAAGAAAEGGSGDLARRLSPAGNNWKSGSRWTAEMTVLQLTVTTGREAFWRV